MLRAPDASSQVGRYSVHDVSTEYVDTGLPEAPAGEQTLEVGEAVVDEPSPHDAIVYDSEPPPAPEEQPEADSRPRRSTPKQRVGHRRSSRPEVGHARDRGTKRTDPGIRARTLRGNVAAATPLPAAKPQPSPPPAAKPSPRPPPAASDSASVVVDPSLTQPISAAPPAAQKRELSGYVPLPRDREAYEAFLRSAAGEHGGAPRARPVWAQQETALIPRDMLEPAPEFEAEPPAWRGAWLKGALGVLMIVVGGGVLWWVLQDDVPSSPRVTEVSSTPTPPSPGARAITLIATEPTGAELLLDGAVIGNTPLEVGRPSSGEMLYLVRLRGFEHQMVRVTSATHEAIHITLVPAPGETPPPSAKSR